MIKLSYRGKDYYLEYNRAAIRKLEEADFNINAINTKPAKMIPLLFYGAFLKNHKDMTQSKANEIYSKVVNKINDDDLGLIGALMEEYSKVVNEMFDEPEDEGNGAVWTVV